MRWEDKPEKEKALSFPLSLGGGGFQPTLQGGGRAAHFALPIELRLRDQELQGGAQPP